MAAIALSTIRQRVATAINTALTSDGWRQTTGTYDTFGRVAGDADSRQHKGYAVGVPRTTAQRDRQRTAEGAYSKTIVGVRWAYQVAAKDQIVSYDAALDAEGSIVKGIIVQARSVDLHLAYVSATRAVDDQGWMTGEITFQALHHLPLV